MSEIELQELCNRINMPEQAKEIIIETANSYDFTRTVDMHRLTHMAEWKVGLEDLKKNFDNDLCGWKMLTCMLLTSLYTKETYDGLGISEEVFYSTMGCFSRFVREHMETYGHYGFDREWWTTRQLSCVLFRLGTLEYEMIIFRDEPSLSIHIPTDANITLENCISSFKCAVEFFKNYFPKYSFKNMSCSSWLLSPELKKVLKDNSRIIQFQNMFQILEVQPEDKEYISWIFKNNKLENAQLPEGTSLQRNVKKYMLEGNNIGSGSGIVTVQF